MVPMIVRNTELTKKLENQLVAVAMDIPVPIRCRGYISVFTLQTEEDIPIEKNIKYQTNPVNEKYFPVSLTYPS